MKTNLVGIENKNIGTIVVFFVIAAERQISLIDFEYCAYNYRSYSCIFCLQRGIPQKNQQYSPLDSTGLLKEEVKYYLTN